MPIVAERGAHCAPGGDWRHRAACLDEDPDLFFPVGTSGPAAEQTDEAKIVCLICPVRAACLEWALATGQDHGIWGGLDEDERRALKGRRTRAARAMAAGGGSR